MDHEYVMPTCERIVNSLLEHRPLAQVAGMGLPALLHVLLVDCPTPPMD